MQQIVFRPDGPHDPDYTVEVADAVSEGVRTLNYATRGRPGLVYPSHVYDVLGRLQAAAAGLDQALRQMSDFLAEEASAGRAVEHRGGPYHGDTAQAVEDASAYLRNARIRAGMLAASLASAQEAISGLEGVA
jgi:hypothetical protein